MDKVQVIAFVGMPGAGKGTCANYVSEKYSVPVIHFGNMVYEEVQRRGLDNVKDEIYVREDMRVKDGPAVLAKHVANKVNQYIDGGKKRVIIDGLYSWSEYKHLHSIFGDSLTVIAVAAPKTLRYKRILERKDSHRKYTSADQITNREIAEIENLEKGGPIANADYTILNNGMLDATLQQLDQVLQEIGFTK